MYLTVVVDSARLLLAAFASLLFASLFAALRVPAMPYAVFVGFVCGIALVGPCPHLTRFQSFVLISLQVMMTIGMLVATRAVAGTRPMTGMLDCCCGAASRQKQRETSFSPLRVFCLVGILGKGFFGVLSLGIFGLGGLGILGPPLRPST